MRVLALDLVSKRIGVAVSDDAGTVATPVATLERTRDRARLHRQVDIAEHETGAGPDGQVLHRQHRLGLGSGAGG